MLKFILFCILVICGAVFYYSDKIPDHNKSGGFDYGDIIHAIAPFLKEGKFKQQDKKQAQIDPNEEKKEPKSEPKKDDSSTKKIQGLRLFKTGTGWFINEEHIVTNSHVIDGCNPGHIYVSNSLINSRALKVRSMSSGYNRTKLYDVFVLRSLKKSEHYAKLQQRYSIKSRENLYATGYPKGDYSFFDVKVRDVQGKSYVRDGSKDVRVDYKDGKYKISNLRLHDTINLEGIADFGASGSSIVNRNGNVVALLFASKKQQEKAFATNALNVRKILNKHKIDYSVSNSKKILDKEQLKQKMDKYTVKIACYK